jgi:hypothetical protein
VTPRRLLSAHRQAIAAAAGTTAALTVELFLLILGITVTAGAASWGERVLGAGLLALGLIVGRWPMPWDLPDPAPADLALELTLDDDERPTGDLSLVCWCTGAGHEIGRWTDNVALDTVTAAGRAAAHPGDPDWREP